MQFFSYHIGAISFALIDFFFRSRSDQFQRNNIDRELNKAFVGFFNEDEGDEPSCIATGNWGNFKIMIRIFFCLHFANACFFLIQAVVLLEEILNSKVLFN